MTESTCHDEPRRPWKEALKRRILKRCSAALAGGAAHVQYLRTLGMPDHRIFMGYDAVDNSYFSERARETRAKETTLRQTYGLPLRYFLASARFIPKKNLIRLLDGYATYLELHQSEQSEDPWSLVLLGSGPLEAAIRRRIRELKIEGRVLLPGFRQYPELPVYYGLAGAFVHASITEQWGLVVNEAMASGLPVIVSDRCGCAADLVKDGENGFLFSPLDHVQLGKLMFHLARNQIDRAAMSGASQRIIRDWGPERFADGLWKAAQRAKEVGAAAPSGVTKALLASLMLRNHVPGFRPA